MVHVGRHAGGLDVVHDTVPGGDGAFSGGVMATTWASIDEESSGLAGSCSGLNSSTTWANMLTGNV